MLSKNAVACDFVILFFNWNNPMPFETRGLWNKDHAFLQCRAYAFNEWCLACAPANRWMAVPDNWLWLKWRRKHWFDPYFRNVCDNLCWILFRFQLHWVRRSIDDDEQDHRSIDRSIANIILTQPCKLPSATQFEIEGPALEFISIDLGFYGYRCYRQSHRHVGWQNTSSTISTMQHLISSHNSDRQMRAERFFIWVSPKFSTWKLIRYVCVWLVFTAQHVNIEFCGYT